MMMISQEARPNIADRVPIHLLLHVFGGEPLPPKTWADMSSVGQVLVKNVEKRGSKFVGHSRAPHQ